MYALPTKTPTRREIEQMEAEHQAECDLNTLVEAAKIRKDPTRYQAAMTKRQKMEEELARVARLAVAPAQAKKPE